MLIAGMNRSNQKFAVGLSTLVFLLLMHGVHGSTDELHDDADTESPDGESVPSTMEEFVSSRTLEEVQTAFQTDDFDLVSQRGTDHFDSKNYDKALPYLLASAKRGFKSAQMYLGIVYFNGWGGLERNTELGVGWLGVAASTRSESSMKETFQRAMKSIPKNLRDRVQSIVDSLTNQYGIEATGVECKNTRIQGTRERWFKCSIKEEFELNEEYFQDWLTTSYLSPEPYLRGVETDSGIEEIRETLEVDGESVEGNSE